MKKKTIIWIIIVLIVLGSIGYGIFRPKKQTYEFVEATTKDLVQTVSVTGELKSETGLNLNFEVAGRVKQIRVKEGQDVAAGDLLAVIDDSTLSDQVTGAKAALDRAIAQAGLTDDEINRLQENVDNAKKVLRDTEDLEDQKVDAAKQSEQDALDNKKDAEGYYEAVVDDNGQDSATARQAKLTLNSAKSSANSANESVQTAERFRDLNVTTAKNAVRSAEDTLVKARSRNQSQFDDANVVAARAQYDTALDNLGKATLKAPVNGKVTQVNYKVGEIIGTASITGTTSIAGTPVIQLMSNDYIIEANVPESDIAKVKIDNTGTVSFDAFGSDERFPIEVVSIEPASTVIQDVVYYVVKFKLTNAFDLRLKPGMTANVDIETNRKTNTLMIPERVVQEDNGRKFVQVLNADGKVVQKIEVKLGIRGDEGMIEVLSGLSQGQRVVSSQSTE